MTFNRNTLGSYSRTVATTVRVLKRPRAQAILTSQRQVTRAQLAGISVQPAHIQVTTRSARQLAASAQLFVDRSHSGPRGDMRVYADVDARRTVAHETLGNAVDIPEDRIERAIQVLAEHRGPKQAALFKAVFDATAVSRGSENLAFAHQVPGHDFSVVMLTRPEYEVGDLFSVLIHEYVHVLQHATGHWFFQGGLPPEGEEESGNRIIMEADALTRERQLGAIAAREFGMPSIIAGQLERTDILLGNVIKLLEVHTLLQTVRGDVPFVNQHTFSAHALGASLLVVANEVLGQEAVAEAFRRGDLSVLDALLDI